MWRCVARAVHLNPHGVQRAGGRLERGAVDLFFVLLLVLAGTGGLSAPPERGYVAFEAIERAHFGAVAVFHDRGDVQTGALVLRVNLVGDATDVDLGEVEAFLARALGIRLLHDTRGVPLFLTRENLIATSGPAALGATVSKGVAAEVGNPSLAPCVIAHEIGHLVGLGHSTAPDALMGARCEPGKLARATVTPSERERVDRLQRIRALTGDGLVLWADRDN